MSDVAELRTLLAEAEQARWEQHEEITALLARLRVADALKREYEEALTAIQAVGKHSRTVPSLQRIARDALAASGGRSDTAEAGGRAVGQKEAPDERRSP